MAPLWGKTLRVRDQGRGPGDRGAWREAVPPDSQWCPSEPAEPCHGLVIARPLSGPGFQEGLCCCFRGLSFAEWFFRIAPSWALCSFCSAGTGRGLWSPLVLLGISLSHVLIFLLLSPSLIQEEAPDPPDSAQRQCVSVACSGRYLLSTYLVSGTWCGGSESALCLQQFLRAVGKSAHLPEPWFPHLADCRCL